MKDQEVYQYLAGKLGVEPRLVPYLAEVFIDMVVLNPVLPETFKRLGPILDLRPGQSVLDLACGKAGASLPLVHVYKVKLTGIEILPDFHREAWSRAEYSGLYELCNFKQGDAAEFVSKTKNQWNAVMCLGATTIIWPSLEEGLEAMRPLVLQGGSLVIGEPYRLDEAGDDERLPKLTKDAITERLNSIGKVVEILDDGKAGWEAYANPQVEAMAYIKKKNPEDHELAEFLNGWARNTAWEMDNIGFAVWVIKLD